MSDQNLKKEENLPKYWIQRVSKSRNGKSYYFNTKTRESVWKLSDVFEKKSDKTKINETNLTKNSPDKKVRKIKSAPKVEQSK